MDSFDVQQLRDLLGPEYFRLTPATFAQKVSRGNWESAPHLEYIASRIAYALQKGNARLIISMPPRHGKSELLSTWTSVWQLDRDPTSQIMLLTYGSDLSEEFGQKVRDIIQEDQSEDGEHLINPAAAIAKDSARVDRFMTVSKGGVRSIGMGGAVYGRGADVMFIDDYYKNVEEAQSAAKRKKIYDWFMSIANSRLHKNGSIIVVATRWDTDDLSANLLKLPGWTEIRLPAIAEKNDPLGREPGEALWPERFPLSRLEELKLMGTYLFNAIYQQVPRKQGSKFFQRHWIMPVEILPHKSRLQAIRSWDRAGTEDDGDWTVGLKMLRDTETNSIYIVDIKREQLSPGKVDELIDHTTKMDSNECTVVIEQEPGSSGKAVAESTIKRLIGYAVKAIKHTGSKFIRAQPFLSACEHGQVFMLRADWNEDFIDELVDFPNGVHDDMVDAATQGFNHFFGKKATAGAWGKKTSNESSSVASSVGASTGTVVTGLTWGRR